MSQKQVLIVNSTASATNTRVNVRVAVNAASIRREQHNGREHIVVPSFTLPDEVVMNGGLYPHDEIEKSYAGLEGTLAPLGHPQVDGAYVSARQPEAINAYHIGAWNRNVKRVGSRISVEKMIDVEFAKNTEGGRKLLKAISKGEPIHTSTGIFLEREMTPNSDGHEWIARNMSFDHDAILIGEAGAATPEDGVGMMVNKTLVINSLVKNDDSVLEDSYGEKEDLLEAAIIDKFSTDNNYVCLEDFDDQAIVYCIGEKLFKISYHLEDGKVVLTGESTPVAEQTSYIATNFRKLMKLFQNHVQYPSTKTKRPVQAIVNEEVDMTPEEVQAIVDKAVGAAVDAVNQKLTSSEAAVKALSDALQANAESGLKDKRTAVAAKYGEVVANALQGEALDAMFASCQTAAPLVPSMPVANSEADPFKGYDMNAHLEAK